MCVKTHQFLYPSVTPSLHLSHVTSIFLSSSSIHHWFIIAWHCGVEIKNDSRPHSILFPLSVPLSITLSACVLSAGRLKFLLIYIYMIRFSARYVKVPFPVGGGHTLAHRGGGEVKRVRARAIKPLDSDDEEEEGGGGGGRRWYGLDMFWTLEVDWSVVLKLAFLTE